MKTVYYIAYGSNLNLKSFFKRCPSAKLLGTDLLKNKALIFKGDAEEYSYLTIEDEDGSIVPIGIFEISYFDSLKLDKYEGFPMLYSKKYLDLDLNGKQLNAFIYVMKAGYDYHLPSLQYFNSCLKGYTCFNFDTNILVNAFLKTSVKMKENEENIRN